jgi:hypothetical protein
MSFFAFPFIFLLGGVIRSQALAGDLVRLWLRKAEETAGIEHECGRALHSSVVVGPRQKHLPDVDVAQTASKSIEALKRSYRPWTTETTVSVFLGGPYEGQDQARRGEHSQ